MQNESNNQEIESKNTYFPLSPVFQDVVKEYARKEIEQMLKIQQLLSEIEEDDIA
jgi:hypothetical protein